MSEERFEVFGNIIKDNEDIPSLLNNYQATVRLNELNDKVKELEQELAELKEMSNLIWIDLFHLNNDNNEWTKSLNKYKEDAQEKLKEIQGNE